MNTLGIFVKQPISGQVKTRLAQDIGNDRAAELYRAFSGDLLDRVRPLGDRRVLAFAPPTDDARSHFTDCAGDDFELWEQPAGDLGVRMHQFFRDHLREPAGRVVLIGSDSPTLPVARIELAFQSLAAHDLVLGPATDGGYYLIGLSRSDLPIFSGIDWSSPNVLEQTVGCLAPSDTSLALLDPWYDIDTLQDLNMLRGHLAALERAGKSPEFPRIREWFDSEIRDTLTPLN